MGSMLDGLINLLSSQVGLFRDRALRAGATSAAALMISADGDFDAKEHEKVSATLEHPIFKQHGLKSGDLLNEIEAKIARLRKDPSLEETYKADVIRLKGTEEAPFVIRFCFFISPADREVAGEEKQIIADLMQELELTRADVGY